MDDEYFVWIVDGALLTEKAAKVGFNDESAECKEMDSTAEFVLDDELLYYWNFSQCAESIVSEFI